MLKKTLLNANERSAALTHDLKKARQQLTIAESRLKRALAALKAAGIPFDEDTEDSVKRPADE